MDMYVRMYDERQKDELDNPTLGLILCSKTNADVMHYSVLNDKDRVCLQQSTCCTFQAMTCCAQKLNRKKLCSN